MTSSLPTTKLLVACGTLLALAGCGGCYKSPDERRLLLTITQPRAGAVLTEADKAAGDLDAGVRADVRLQLEWESLTSGKREAAAFGSAALELRRTDVDGGTFAQAPSGAAQFEDGGFALLPGVDFPENGSYELRATAAAADSDLVPEPATVALKVEVLEHRPVLDGVTFPQDLNADGTLNAAELAAGAPLQLAINGHDALGGTVTIVSEDGGTVYVDAAAFPADGGTWSVDVGAAPLEQALAFRVTLRDEQGRPSLDPVLLPSIYVDQVAPVVALLSPADGGYKTHTLQGQAQVTGAPEGTLVHFVSTFVDGGTWDAGVYATDDGGMAAGELVLEDGEQLLVARAADVAGNLGESPGVPLVITANSCNVTLTQPAGALFAGPEANVADGGTDFLLVVAGTSNCPNQAVTVKVDDASVATGTTDANGNFSLQVPVAPGTTRALVVDVNGSTTLPTPVLTSSTAFALTSPSPGQALSLVNDDDGQLAGVQYAFGYAPSAGTFQVTACGTLGTGPSPAACPDGASGWFVLAENVGASVANFTYPDGSYQVKAVMLSGSTVLSTTPAVPVSVDGTRPAVAALALQGDTNGDFRLNLAEQAAGDAVVLVTADGLEVGQNVSIYRRGTSTRLGFAPLAVVGAPVAVTLSGIPGTTDELDEALEVRMTDAAGNANDTALPTAQADIRVDRLAPGCTLTAPTRAAVGVADDADAAAGFQLAMAASATADTAAVQLRANLLTGTAVVSGALASGMVTLPATGTTQYALGCTATDTSGNTGTEGTGSVTVDLDVPAPVITAPGAGTQASFVLATSVSVPGEADGLTVNIYSTPTGGAKALVGALSLVGGTASGNVTYPTAGAQQLTAEVTDGAGNLGTSAPVQIDQQSSGCSIQLTAPAGVAQFLNAADGTVSGGKLQVTVAGTSTNCKGTAVKVYSGSGLRTEVASGSTDGATGAFSLQPSALAEGVQHLEVEMVDSLSNTTTVPWDFTVDITPPGASAVQPAEAALTVVAPANTHLWNAAGGTFWAADGGYYADTSTGTAGGQLAISLSVTGAQGGTVEVYFDGGRVAGPADVTADPGAVALTATLPQGAAGLDVQVKDVAGNVLHALGATGTPTVVDVVPPAVPSPALTLKSDRAATVGATWSAALDDSGDATSGNVTTFDVRWSTSVINPSLTEAHYFDATKFLFHTGALLGGTSTDITVPPLVTTSVVVRAVDDVGNLSALPAAAATQANSWTLDTVAPAGASANFEVALPLAVADLSGNSAPDVVLGADGTNGSEGAVFILEGRTDGQVPSNTVRLDPPDSFAGQGFGYAAAVGNFVDDGEGLTDLLVSAPMYGAGGEGRVVGYTRASSGSSLALAFTITGQAGQFLGSNNVAVIQDINGDGRSEILISDPFSGGNGGLYYLFLGRARTGGGAFAASLTVADADLVIQGPNTPGTAWFGYNFGATSVGTLASGANDFTLSASAGDVNSVYVMSAARLSAEPRGATVVVTDNNGTGQPYAVQTLTRPDYGGNSSDATGLGTAAVGGAHLLGGAAADLAVSTGSANEVRIFADATAAGFTAAPSLVIQRTVAAQFGSALAVSDVTGDGNADLLVGEALSNTRSVWLLPATGVVGSEFDTSVGDSFHQAVLTATDLLGTRVATADVTGDGKADIIAVSYNGTTLETKVLVWH